MQEVVEVHFQEVAVVGVVVEDQGQVGVKEEEGVEVAVSLAWGQNSQENH